MGEIFTFPIDVGDIAKFYILRGEIETNLIDKRKGVKVKFAQKIIINVSKYLKFYSI